MQKNLLKKSATLPVFEILTFINHCPEMLDASQTFSAHFRQISGKEIKNILKVCVYRFVWSQDGFLPFLLLDAKSFTYSMDFSFSLSE